MFKQAFSMMFYRKKQALIVILVIALVMFLLFGISSVFSAVRDSTFLVAVEECGAFHCIYYDLKEQHFAQLREIATIREIGQLIENIRGRKRWVFKREDKNLHLPDSMARADML